MTRRAITHRLTVAAIAAVVFLAVGATTASAGTTEHARLSHGTNGQPDSNGAAKKVKESDGGAGALLTSVNLGYGLISVKLPASTTLSELTALSTGYEVTEGTCAGGSPRFAVVVLPAGDRRLRDAQVIWVYFGAQPYGGSCTPQQGLATADATQSAWWTDGGNTQETYAQALSTMGTDRLVAVQVAVDGGWDQTPEVQQVLIQDLTVGINGSDTNFFPLPS
jgi:hypothetical protein